MKKIICISMTIIMLLVLVFAYGCGSGERGYEIQDGEIIINKPVVIRFAAPEGQFGDEINAFAQGFKKLYPQVTIKYEPVSGDWSTKLMTQIASGTAPDVFWESPYRYASMGQLAELDSYFDTLGVNKSDYFESMFNFGKYNGKLYMLPRDYNKVVVYYNKTIFNTVFNSGKYTAENLPFTYDEAKYQETGKFYPSNGWSWTEFVNTAQAIAVKSGNNFVQRGAEISLNWDASGPLILEALGCTIRQEKDGKETIDLDNEKNREIIQREILDRIDSGAFVNSVYNDVGNFYNGRTGMQINSRPVCSITQEALGNEWDVVTFPLIEGNEVIPTGCSGYCVYNGSKVKELAIRFLFYIISDEGQQTFMKTGNCVPFKKELAQNSPTWREYPRKDINHEAFIWGDEYDVTSYSFQFADVNAQGNFEDYWGNFVVALLNGDKTLSEALTYGQAELNKIFIQR